MSGSRQGRPQIKPPAGHLLVGLLHKPHGLGGEITAQLLSDVPERFDIGAVVYMSLPPGPAGRKSAPPGGGASPIEIVGSRRNQGRWLLRLEGCHSREDADELRGALLSIPESEAIIAEGQFLPDELVGLEVVSAGGEQIGVVAEVLDYPAQDILEVRTEHGSRMIPFVRELVPRVDLDEGVITLSADLDLESFLGFEAGTTGASEP